MSDFVDLMLEGVICDRCGQFFGDAAGYPRTCDACLTPGLAGYLEVNPPKPEPPENCAPPEDAEDDLPF